ncbi:pseudaminic acid cytidylyltransferase [Oceanospirillum beijerinckii]|uniref:pseudaminic acid cytidylyltransferase n=1 Tax=Oceanospirillum beijerinckii TaxID=64976 RepID=UPI00040C8A33|nr:pseudaminic acid cytidylyltransferase [Oceanospirillum beijerinckii]
MNLCVIPARGGSKRIPGKNIREFCGKPMIAWSIERAIESGAFDKIIVSTDSSEIAEVAKSYGAEVPFIRPEELADDFTDTLPVIKHAITAMADLGLNYKYVCCLYATAPFVLVNDLKKGLGCLMNKPIDYAFSVTSYAFPIQRALKVNGNGGIEMLHPEHRLTRSQDLEEYWHDAGQFYWGAVDAWLSQRKIFSDRSAPVVLDRYRVQDIDTMADWVRAELMFKMMQTEGRGN